MSHESRRAERRNVNDSVVVTDAMTEQVVGRLANLSETGMLLGASVPLLDNALYQLRFALPDRSGQLFAFEVGAHLIWVGDANTPGQSWAGLRFLNLGEQQLAALRQWLGSSTNRTR